MTTLLQGRTQDTTLLQVNLMEGKHLQGTCKSTHSHPHMLCLKSSTGNSTWASVTLNMTATMYKPGNVWNGSTIVLYKAPSCLQHISLVQTEESMSRGCWCVLGSTVCVLQWSKLVLSQHLPRRKVAVPFNRNTHRQPTHAGRGGREGSSGRHKGGRMGGKAREDV